MIALADCDTVTDPVLSDGSSSFTPGLSVRNGGSSRFFFDDRMGTATKETDSAQSVTATRTYDAFGNMVSTSGSSPSPFGYAGGYGYQEDATGLKLLGHRYYDPTTGRFLTRDPIRDGKNWYAYCNNNPLRWVDPEGFEKVVIVVGEGNGNEPRVNNRHHRLATLYGNRYRRLGWDVVILYCPTKEQLKRSLKGANGLIFCGHGNPESGQIGRTVVFGLSPKWLKSALGGTKLRFVVLESCYGGKESSTVRQWLELVTSYFSAYTTGTDGNRRSDDFFDFQGWKPRVWRRDHPAAVGFSGIGNNR